MNKKVLSVLSISTAPPAILPIDIKARLCRLSRCKERHSHIVWSSNKELNCSLWRAFVTREADEYRNGKSAAACRDDDEEEEKRALDALHVS